MPTPAQKPEPGDDRPLEAMIPAQEHVPESGGYMIQLDGLRAIAALGVIAHHTLNLSSIHFPGGLHPGNGVRLFFVLSGFLITGILLRSRDCAAGTMPGLRHEFSTFYIRRVLRIFPLYYFVLFASTIVGLPGVRYEFFWHLTYLSNYFLGKSGSGSETLGHFWSLAVEEQFYLMWPAIILLTPRKRLLPMLVATWLFSLISYFVMVKVTWNGDRAGAMTFTNLDALVAGAMLAWFRHQGRDNFVRRFSLVALLAAVVLILPEIILDKHGQGRASLLTVRRLFSVLIFTWLVDGAARGFGGVAGRFLSLRPVVYLGTISYGIYVYHLLIEPVVTAFSSATGVKIPWPAEVGLRKFVCTTITAVAIASLSWRFFEKPLNDVKRFFPYRANPNSVVKPGRT